VLCAPYSLLFVTRRVEGRGLANTFGNTIGPAFYHVKHIRKHSENGFAGSCLWPHFEFLQCGMSLHCKTGLQRVLSELLLHVFTLLIVYCSNKERDCFIIRCLVLYASSFDVH